MTRRGRTILLAAVSAVLLVGCDLGPGPDVRPAADPRVAFEIEPGLVPRLVPNEVEDIVLRDIHANETIAGRIAARRASSGSR
jgi:hypothetical protein